MSDAEELVKQLQESSLKMVSSQCRHVNNIFFAMGLPQDYCAHCEVERLTTEIAGLRKEREGMVLLPREPDLPMLVAGHDAAEKIMGRMEHSNFMLAAWQAMIDAAMGALDSRR